jgi:hypothetical protein
MLFLTCSRADCESVLIIVASMTGVLMVERRRRRNLASLAASESAIYSASMVESTTIVCLLDCQEMGLLARKKM